MVRRLLSLFRKKIQYRSEYGTRDYRYGGLDYNMGRPIHANMRIAPPWAKMEIVSIECNTNN